MWGETMKETYHVPRAPDIAGSENLVNTRDSEELMNVLGFCTPQALTAPTANQQKILKLRAIETAGFKADDDHCAGQKTFPLHTGWEDVELKVEAK
jgi:hypothetical protein